MSKLFSFSKVRLTDAFLDLGWSLIPIYLHKCYSAHFEQALFSHKMALILKQERKKLTSGLNHTTNSTASLTDTKESAF